MSKASIQPLTSKTNSDVAPCSDIDVACPCAEERYRFCFECIACCCFSSTSSASTRVPMCVCHACAGEGERAACRTIVISGQWLFRYVILALVRYAMISCKFGGIAGQTVRYADAECTVRACVHACVRAYVRWPSIRTTNCLVIKHKLGKSCARHRETWR